MKLFTQQISQSKTLVLFFGLFLFLNTSSAQTTVFMDDFNREENPLSTTGGTPTMTWTGVTTAGSVIRTNIGIAGTPLIIVNGSTAGRSYLYGQLSLFTNPFVSTLSSNTENVEWTFNIRTNRTSSSLGFDAVNNRIGTAVVLAANGSDFLTASGYAVTLTQGTTNNAVRLVKFSNGLSAQSNLTTIIGPSVDAASQSNYFSVKVIYKPASNKWELYARVDGTTIIDPTSGTLTKVGAETIDDTYTSNALSNFGFFLNHQSATASSNSGYFDNFKVVTSPDPTTNLHFGSQMKDIVKPISGGFSVSAENADVKIFDSMGKLVANKVVNGTFDYITATKGMYIVRISTSMGFDVMKQIVL